MSTLTYTSLFSLIKVYLVKLRIYISRSNSYAGMFNTGMIFIIFLKQFGVDTPLIIFLAFMSTILLFAIIGYLEVRLGMWKIGSSIANKNNPELQEILFVVRDVREQLKKVQGGGD